MTPCELLVLMQHQTNLSLHSHCHLAFCNLCLQCLWLKADCKSLSQLLCWVCLVTDALVTCLSVVMPSLAVVCNNISPCALDCWLVPILPACVILEGQHVSHSFLFLLCFQCRGYVFIWLLEGNTVKHQTN